jgi:CheY-like chemotaxis protein
MEAVGRLAGGIAHDFNNLLTVILGEVELILADSPSDIAFRPGLEEVKKSGERAAMLTRQLLAFSRRQLITPELVELNSVITDMSKMLGRLIGEDVAFQLRLSPAAGTVRADRGQLEQVLANLVVNARDAMPHGGALTLSTSREVLDEEYAASHADAKPGEYAMLAVSDSGTGMSDSVKARIFEPFFTTKEAGKGTGLGLAVSYGIIKQAGGHISAYSESGLGTTIKVYLPQVVAEEPLGTAKVSPELPRGTETILVVEDEEAVRRVTMRVLTRLGYRVLEARDAEDAKRVLSGHDGTVHLLFTDVVLPGIGGRELAEQIQLLRPQIKLLFASGYTDDVVLRHLLIERSAALLQKPFTNETIARAVRNALDS